MFVQDKRVKIHVCLPKKKVQEKLNRELNEKKRKKRKEKKKKRRKDTSSFYIPCVVRGVDEQELEEERQCAELLLRLTKLGEAADGRRLVDNVPFIRSS